MKSRISDACRRWPTVLAFALSAAVAATAWGVDGAYVGKEIGASVPANDNYRAHAEAGIMGSPYVGFMFNDYIGLQGNL